MSVDVEAPIAARPRWDPGDRVTVRATRCTILKTERFADCDGLQAAPLAPPDVPFGMLLVPFDRPRRVDLPASPRTVGRRRWLHALRAVAARQLPFGGLRAAARSRIDLLPYQLEPALAVNRHAALRVLIADEVGLGKTIQAGLVLAEVLERDSCRRALVAMPAGLRAQWQSELRVRFDIEAPVCDAAWLRERTRELPPDANPWSLPGTYLVSLDFIKRPEVLKAIEELLWDLVVIDEAHTVTSGTDRRAAVDAVASRARRVLLLTGTPHSGDEAQFEALLRIGEGPSTALRAGAAATPILMFRRTRADVGRDRPRRSTLLRVRPSEAEQRMHELLERYASRVWREARLRGDRNARLMAIVLRKRALSSAGSLAASLARRIDLLASAERGAGAVQLQLPLAGREDELHDCVPDEVLAAPGLADPAVERRWLGAVLEAARRASRDETKLARLSRFLTRASEPAIVFTEYRDTLARLTRALKTVRHPVLTLHGGMTAAERRTVQETFNGRPALLLATDAAAEGLNLQQRCRLVIHFELPWNPLRLEQRAGRVDRIGQTARVHELALIADGTAERLVLAPLARRARNAKALAANGSRMLELISESAVEGAVMSGDDGSAATPIKIPISTPSLPLELEAAEEASRLGEVRGWVAQAGVSTGERRPVMTVLGRGDRAPQPAATLVFSLASLTADGHIVHCEPLVVRVDLYDAVAVSATKRHSLEALQHVLRRTQPRIDALAAQRFGILREEVARKHTHVLALLREREIAIAGERSSTARQLVQAVLFDRRTIRQADRRATVQTRRDEDAAEMLASLGRAEMLTESVRLEAALIRTGARR